MKNYILQTFSFFIILLAIPSLSAQSDNSTWQVTEEAITTQKKVGIGIENPALNLDIVNAGVSRMSLGSSTNGNSSINFYTNRPSLSNWIGKGTGNKNWMIQAVHENGIHSNGTARVDRGDLGFWHYNEDYEWRRSLYLDGDSGDIFFDKTIQVKYFDFNHKDEKNGYEYVRFGTPDNHYAGLMYNQKNKYYGEGDNFTIFTYKDRDIILRAGTKGKVVANNRMSINTYKIPSEYTLAVGGKIIAEELKIKLSNKWADYVFDENYHLASLKEVEQHIQEKGHLPNVPSAEELEKADGFEVSKMTNLQQEKIEELFLHLIEMDKKMEQLKEENQALKTRVVHLEKK